MTGKYQMKGLQIIRSSTRTPSTLLSSGLHPISTTSGLNPTAKELFTTVVTIYLGLFPDAVRDLAQRSAGALR